ncbi:MAG: hypothetical protein MZV65_42210 [Chromatiales bacterium]|nr:hypothetical protein [Chromatiales bacterium]
MADARRWCWWTARRTCTAPSTRCRRSPTRQGEPTGAVLGVLNMLRQAAARSRPAADRPWCSTRPGKTFRDELFAEYKAHRDRRCPTSCVRRSSRCSRRSRRSGCRCCA